MRKAAMTPTGADRHRAARLRNLKPDPPAGALADASMHIRGVASSTPSNPPGTVGLLLISGLIGVVLTRSWIARWEQSCPAVQAWLTVFVAMCLQALPFLLLGVALGTLISEVVPARRWLAALPERTALAVPMAGAAGAVLPGCECASVPVAAALMRQGMAPAPALAFLLAAPAINPIVLVATSVAFPGQPEMVLARLLASLAAAVVMGWAWARWGRDDWMRLLPRPRGSVENTGRASMFLPTMRHDLLHTGGFLVLGAAAAATVNVAVPTRWLASIGGRTLVSVITLGLLAVVVAICSEADAFVAASFSHFSRTAMLAFMVVGPMVDLKLIAMQAGTFGRGFALRFAPVTFAVAVAAAAVVGTALL